MKLLIQIEITQILVAFIILMLMHPKYPCHHILVKVFGDYGHGLDIIMGTQYIGIIVTAFFIVWSF